MINNTKSYFRKDTSTLFISSAAIAMLLSSTLLLSNTLLLQPAQATTISLTSMQTQNPANLGRSCSAANATLTFEAKGNGETLTNGTFRIADSNSGQILWSGGLSRANSLDGDILLVYGVDGNVPVCGIGSGDGLQIQTDCGPNIIGLSTDGGDFREVAAAVDCEPPRDTTTAQQPSSTPMTGTTTTQQDSDSDGIPDSSDNCPNHSHHRCYKDGGDTGTTTSTTTDQQSQPSSSPSSSSSTTGTTTQDGDSSSDSSSGSNSSNDKDSDSDGIPDSSDNCPNHSHHRCYKDGGDTGTTSTDDQQPSSSSSSGNGNQTG